MSTAPTGTGGIYCGTCHTWWSGGQHVCPYVPTTLDHKTQAPPYRCPVCEGRGTVPGLFYEGLDTANITCRESCRSCDGKGVIWR